MRFIRGDIVEHIDGSIYVVEESFPGSLNVDEARLAIIVETVAAYNPSWYLRIPLSDHVFKKIAHTELDEKREQK